MKIDHLTPGHSFVRSRRDNEADRFNFFALRLRWGLIALFLLSLCFSFPAIAGETRFETSLSGPGWKLWQDKDAAWENDELFLPPVDLAKLPVNPPTGGWQALDSTNAMTVLVPGTVEQYLQKIPGPEGDLKGVSWWWRTVRAPASQSPRRFLLKFESVRMRAEVYVNQKLAGYDLIGNTPFDVDITRFVKPGELFQLAVRITDPGGNFDWRDSSPFEWGHYTFPMSHGFGGITGRVRLVACDPVYVDDIYVQNTPAITNVNVIVTVKNTTTGTIRRNLAVSASERKGTAVAPDSAAVFVQELKDVELKPGDNLITCPASGSAAQLWTPDRPNLYSCKVVLKDGQAYQDTASQNFGFRWFAPEGIGSNAVFRLNGKRIVLRTAISWGFWPISGMVPTLQLADREIRTAKDFGLNMLNFHRCIGNPISFERADELGLLIYEEPGGYGSGSRTEFSRALAREKLLRMVKRDRSHPSLIIYNMINESWEAARDKTILDARIRDIRDAHALDPGRVITHTSAWAYDPEGPAKMHMRPFDNTVHMSGWYDFHHAGGPEVWRQESYQSPKKFYGRTTNTNEITYWGEEGAISTPPRLGPIKTVLESAPFKGWDGEVYLDWYRQFDSFITRKNLRSAFPSVEALTVSMGNVSLEHQARKIENHRISDANDGYAINGWEAQIIENHSGIVDCFRFPKGDPSILRRRNEPLFIAVKPRSQFAQIPGEITADFYIVNELNCKGPHTLQIIASNPNGGEVFKKNVPVDVSGGEVYGQLLAEGITIPIAGATGMFRIDASLLSGDETKAVGYDTVLAVDWKSAALTGKGAVWEGAKDRVARFLRDEKQFDAPAYRDDAGKLDWVIVARPPDEGAPTDIATEYFRTPSGQPGLQTTFFGDADEKLHQRVDSALNFTVESGATPDPAVRLTEGYRVHWEGTVSAPTSGMYTFVMQCAGATRVSLDGSSIMETRDRNPQTLRGRVKLEAGKAVPLVVDYTPAARRNGRCTLSWAPPETNAPNPQRLFDRVRDDGTTLLVLDRAETWMDLIQTNTAVRFNGSFKLGLTWLGGQQFVRDHPLFKGLPVNQAMNWPYQAVVRDGRNRLALKLEGEELVVGAWHSYPMDLGTSVAVIPCGKGRIVVSTLDLCDSISGRDSDAHVARKLLCNFIEYASAPKPAQKSN
jgi:hypothetical protein